MSLPNHKKAEKDYLKGMKYKELAEKYGVSINTIKSWKQRYNWSRQSVHTKEKVCTQKKSVQKNVKKEEVKIEVTESENSKLTEKQRLFCLYFVNNRNATLAAIKAGYSAETARQIGYENLTKPYIRAEVERLKEIKRQSIMLDEDDIVERYMRIAFADMTDFVEFGQEEFPVITKDGLVELTNPVTGEKEPLMQKVNIIKFKEANQVDGGLICEIKTSKQGASIKLEDRQKALAWLADFFEMNPEHKHRKAHDQKKLELERERFEHTKEVDKIKVW